MWQALYPGVPEDKVPIGHITNGIHLLGWMKGSVRQFWREKLTNGGDGETPTACCPRANSADDWARGHSTRANSGRRWPTRNFVSDEELWALRYRLRRELIEFARRRLLLPKPARHARRLHPLRPPAESRRADHRLRAPLRHLQTRAADFPAVRQHRETRARQAAARAVHFRRQGASARRRRQAVHPADHPPQQTQRPGGQSGVSSKTTTSTSRGRWFPAATSG